MLTLRAHGVTSSSTYSNGNGNGSGGGGGGGGGKGRNKNERRDDLDWEQQILKKRGVNPLRDGLSFMKLGAQALASDEFSKCFVPKPRNTLVSYLLKGLRAPLSLAGVFVRYLILFPWRLLKLAGASAIFFSLLPLVLSFKSDHWRRLLFRFYCKAFLSSWGSQVKRIGKKPILSEPAIYVSNHTSVIDYLVLSADAFPHATVAQRHKGIMGWFQKYVLALNGSLVFERSEKNDRVTLAKKMREHVFRPASSPLLIFPEGTCVNNEYTVLFHKGAFELGAMVVPVAIKYDKNWADAYWHSKTQSFTRHLLYLMTRWKLVATVTYLPPRKRRAGQTAVEFANEVKKEISEVAGLKNLSWDGYWKNYIPPAEKQERMKEDPRKRYGNLLLRKSRSDSNSFNKHTRRFSFESDGSLPFDMKEEYSPDEQDWKDQGQTDQSLRNQVLVSLQDQERKDLMTTLKEKKNDCVETWKLAAKKKSSTTDLQSLELIDHRRVENISWRLWFRDHLAHLGRRRREKEESEFEGGDGPLSPLTEFSEGVLSVVTNFLAMPSRLYNSPANSDVEGDDEDEGVGGISGLHRLSPKSASSTKKLMWTPVE